MNSTNWFLGGEEKTGSLFVKSAVELIQRRCNQLSCKKFSFLVRVYPKVNDHPCSTQSWFHLWSPVLLERCITEIAKPRRALKLVEVVHSRSAELPLVDFT